MEYTNRQFPCAHSAVMVDSRRLIGRSYLKESRWEMSIFYTVICVLSVAGFIGFILLVIVGAIVGARTSTDADLSDEYVDSMSW